MAPACSLDTELQELDTKELHSCLIQGRFWLCQQEQLDCQELRLSHPICFGSLHLEHRTVQSKSLHMGSPCCSAQTPLPPSCPAAQTLRSLAQALPDAGPQHSPPQRRQRRRAGRALPREEVTSPPRPRQSGGPVQHTPPELCRGRSRQARRPPQGAPPQGGRPRLPLARLQHLHTPTRPQPPAPRPGHRRRSPTLPSAPGPPLSHKPPRGGQRPAGSGVAARLPGYERGPSPAAAATAAPRSPHQPSRAAAHPPAALLIGCTAPGGVGALWWLPPMGKRDGGSGSAASGCGALSVRERCRHAGRRRARLGAVGADRGLRGAAAGRRGAAAVRGHGAADAVVAAEDHRARAMEPGR